MDPTLAWLLDPADPAVRAKALVELAGRAPEDPDVQAARKESVARGSVARLLDGLSPLPAEADALYVPKYGAPFHRVVALAEMGAPAVAPAGAARRGRAEEQQDDASSAGNEPRLAAAMDKLIEVRARPDGGFGRTASHLCVTGNMVRAATLLGRGDDPRVRSGIQWLVEHQLPNGAWTCFPDEDPVGTLDSWEALGAFAALPERERPHGSVRSGIEYVLSQKLGIDDGYAPWTRIHFPRHYYYDALVGLDVVTALGATKDERLAPALAWLRSKRRADGTWALDAQHPDIGPGSDYTPHYASVTQPVAPLVVEETGVPSRWATLAAMRVLARIA